ncbi:hypothetical protein K432DRAFT_413447 [Lepidopterella palustris CBS 459.81]|uniref:Nucleoporin Nup82 n=1 Tax=Lepidopterella palustris CBS 459.81 TaxID=1314670 RepID=A0A8E2EK18_9PEZI|nr:hypothetical protein K432DRAFT_413447 [Lepidopterella palustris CBS 459.81]
MPKVLSYTPSWLSRPSPGFDLFAANSNAPTKAPNGLGKATEYSGPLRTIATRNSEVFVAVGNEIRWSDLVLLQETDKASRSRFSRSQSRSERTAYEDDVGFYRVSSSSNSSSQPRLTRVTKVLKVSIHRPIKQLVISPQGEYMAITTSHTAYIAVLPDSALLNSEDTSVLKLKTFQLGPTAHVLEQPPIASVIWHPLGYRGRCLVTVTTDAVVRLWELNRADRSTFNEPALAIDLKKLANATSADDNLSASKYGATKGFSPDSVELEVASACFGGSPRSQDAVHGWAPMTLWVAMKEGDVYALCPLIPSKWQLNRTSSGAAVIETLTTSINSRYASLEDQLDISEDERRSSTQQLSWLSDIIYQEHLIEDGLLGEAYDVYSRPTSTPPIPKLQGPFSLVPELDEDFELADIIVSGFKILGDDLEEAKSEGLPASVVCLLTTSCEVHICLDLDGIEGRWLPSGKSQQLFLDADPEHDLLVFETVKLLEHGNETTLEPSHPSITIDVNSDNSFFVTHDGGISYLSMASWMQKLERELSNAQSEGAEFRLNVFMEGAQTRVESTICIPKDLHQGNGQPIASCVIIEDSDIGYFLLTTVQGEPYAATLDSSNDELPFDDSAVERYMAFDDEALPQRLELRQSYQAPRTFWKKSELATFIEERVPARRKNTLKDEVRLSPATLELLMNAHRILSQETHQLGLAAADLFRRCERLKDEFNGQIFRAAKLTARIDGVTGDDEEGYEGSEDDERVVGSARIEQRLEEAKAKQTELVARHDQIRKKLAKIGGRDLSEQEQAWIAEIEKIYRSVEGSTSAADHSQKSEDFATWQRIEEVRRLKEELLAQAKETGPGLKDDVNFAIKVPREYRNQRMAHVQEMLDRETSMVDAVSERMSRLNILIS